MSPEVPLKVLTSGAYRRPAGNMQGTLRTPIKIDNLTIKLYSRCKSPCITYLFLFSQEKQVFKYSKWRRPWTSVRTSWGDVLGTSAGRRSNMFDTFNSQTNKTYFNRLLKTLYWIAVA